MGCVRLKSRRLDVHTAALQPSETVLSNAPVLIRTSNEEAQISLWRAAWVSKYKPNHALSEFDKAVREYACYSAYDVYARVLPLIQGSGAGKSRMLDEAAKNIFTIPICLRPTGGNGT